MSQILTLHRLALEARKAGHAGAMAIGCSSNDHWEENHKFTSGILNGKLEPFTYKGKVLIRTKVKNRP